MNLLRLHSKTLQVLSNPRAFILLSINNLEKCTPAKPTTYLN